MTSGEIGLMTALFTAGGAMLGVIFGRKGTVDEKLCATRHKGLNEQFDDMKKSVDHMRVEDRADKAEIKALLAEHGAKLEKIAVCVARNRLSDGY